MTITMTEKHQVTIPRKISDLLGLAKGSMFEIAIRNNRIELIPLETKEKVFTKDVCKKLESLSREEKGKEKRMTKRFIGKLKEAKD